LFPEIIRPALSDRKGYCVFIGTPQGMNNNFYDMYQHAQNNKEDWFFFRGKASATEVVDKEELEKAREIMGENKFKQEFECDWIANIEGAVYAEVLQKMDNQRQITRVPYDPALPVSTAWDLGVSDHTAIIFFSTVRQCH
jgi:phage terminase large subunit